MNNETDINIGTSNSNNSNNSNSQNSNNSINMNDKTINYTKFNPKIQLDENKINSLKYNLMNRNIINLNNLNMKNLTSQNASANRSNLINFDNTTNGNNNKSTNQNNLNENNNTSNVENIYIKAFILNKINQILSNSNLTEKIVLYNLISNGNLNLDSISETFNNKNDFSTFLNFFSLNDSISSAIEKHFQIEIVKFTIENFCKYLKSNGYVIVKKTKNEKYYEKYSPNSSNQPNSNKLNNNIVNNDINIPEIDLNEIVNDQRERELGLNEIDYEEIDAEEGYSDIKKMKEIICPHTDKKHYAKVILIFILLEYV
jgi:hypothetical protein